MNIFTRKNLHNIFHGHLAFLYREFIISDYSMKRTFVPLVYKSAGLTFHECEALISRVKLRGLPENVLVPMLFFSL